MEEQLTIEGIKNGAALEALNHEIQKVMDNIVDPNADPDKQRSVTLTVTFKPKKNQNILGITAQAKSTLAPDRAIETAATVGRQGNKGYAAEIPTGQAELPTEAAGNVTPMPHREAQASH
jgi:hypothetical protein